MFREKAALNQYILTNRPLRLCQRPFGLTSGATCRRLLVRLKQRVTRAGASRYLVHRSSLWVQLLDATRHYVEMKKSQGNKRHEIGDGLLGKPDHIGDIVRLYDAYRDGTTSRVLVAGQEKEVVCARLFDNRDFGYLRLTVERPLRLNFRVTDERRARMAETAAFKAFGVSKKKFGSAAHAAEVHAGTMCQFEVMVAIGTLLSERGYRNRDEFSEVLNAAFKKVGLKVPAPLKKAILTALSERDPTADIPVAESVAKEAPSLSCFYPMELHLTDVERAALRALQQQHRDGPGYVPVTVVLLLAKGRSVPPTHADAMGRNQIASLNVSAFFGLVVVWELLMIKGWRN